METKKFSPLIWCEMASLAVRTIRLICLCSDGSFSDGDAVIKLLHLPNRLIGRSYIYSNLDGSKSEKNQIGKKIVFDPKNA
jgi:hypothetical protein